jgi:hypothetical protein
MIWPRDHALLLLNENFLNRVREIIQIKEEEFDNLLNLGRVLGVIMENAPQEHDVEWTVRMGMKVVERFIQHFNLKPFNNIVTL